MSRKYIHQLEQRAVIAYDRMILAGRFRDSWSLWHRWLKWRREQETFNCHW